MERETGIEPANVCLEGSVLTLRRLPHDDAVLLPSGPDTLRRSRCRESNPHDLHTKEDSDHQTTAVVEVERIELSWFCLQGKPVPTTTPVAGPARIELAPTDLESVWSP
jgi:hypothetical protein